MLILITTSKKGTGERCSAAVNSEEISTAVFVPDIGMTAINMKSGQPTLWAFESPTDIAQAEWENKHG